MQKQTNNISNPFDFYSIIKKGDGFKNMPANLQEILALIATCDLPRNSDDKKRENKKTVSGRWNKQQNQIYLNFLRNHQEQFANQFNRRQHRVFYKLSLLLNGSRSSQQCKSHHQKMQLKAKLLLKAMGQKAKKYSNTITIQQDNNNNKQLNYLVTKQKSDRIIKQNNRLIRQQSNVVKLQQNNIYLGYKIYSSKKQDFQITLQIDLAKLDVY